MTTVILLLFVPMTTVRNFDDRTTTTRAPGSHENTRDFLANRQGGVQEGTMFLFFCQTRDIQQHRVNVCKKKKKCTHIQTFFF